MKPVQINSPRARRVDDDLLGPGEYHPRQGTSSPGTEALGIVEHREFQPRTTGQGLEIEHDGRDNDRACEGSSAGLVSATNPHDAQATVKGKQRTSRPCAGGDYRCFSRMRAFLPSFPRR